LPLAQNYLSSGVFERVEKARVALSELPRLAGGYNQSPSVHRAGAGLWSELSFRLRRPLGILTGAIDKLLITPAADGKGFDVEIIDFKTNRLRQRRSGPDLASTSLLGPRAPRGPQRGSSAGVAHSPAASNASDQAKLEPDQLLASSILRSGRWRPRSQNKVKQIAFEFNAPITPTEEVVVAEPSVEDQVRIAASDYQLQMQAYALAVGELLPELTQAGSSIISTLHFLDPNVEFHLDSDLLSPDACVRAIDAAMSNIISSRKPAQFPVRTATHCRMCNFLGICQAGREWVRSKQKVTG